MIAEEDDVLSVHKLGSTARGKSIKLEDKGFAKVELSPDGTLAVLRKSRGITVVDLIAEKVLYRMGSRMASESKSLAFSPDGKTMVIGRAYGATFLVDARTGNYKGLYVPHYENATDAVALSANGMSIISAERHKIRVWPARKALETSPPIHANRCWQPKGFRPLPGLITLPQNQILGTYGRSTVYKGDGSTDALNKLSESESAVAFVAKSLDDQRLAIAMINGKIEIRNVNDGARLVTFGTHPEKIKQALITPDGNHLISQDIGGVAALWSVRTGKAARIYDNADYKVRFTGLTADGKLALIGGPGFITVLDDKEEKPLQTWASVFGDETPMAHAQFLDEDRILIMENNGRTIVINWKTTAVSADFRLSVDEVPDVLVTSPDKAVLAYNDRGHVILQNLNTGKDMHLLSHDITAESIQFDASGQRLLTTAGDSTARLWDVESGEEIARYVGHGGIVESARFLPGEREFMTLGADRLICFYDVVDGR